MDGNSNNRMFIGTYQCNDFDTLLGVVRESIECGIFSFDTAPSYKTEHILGKVLQTVMMEDKLSRESLFISDKIDAWQMRRYNGDVQSFIETALRKLRTDYIDLLLIHWPVEEYFEKTWESMLKCKEIGIIRNVGICNIRARHLISWQAKGIIPSYVQIERHPLRTCKEEMAYCKDHGITVLSYSPLGRMMPQIKESKILCDIADRYEKNIGQVILRWQIDTNAIPVFASKKPGRIKSNTKIEDFHLEQREIDMIETLNSNYKIYLESWGCPGF